ncbi:trace amine-associated receptor 13c-like [Astatotilapia calliptera]|uniref:trace amine-associated receptor 13c-like n=1 Tax=Astatotilapia calliptera TaxID=8154 RepID=UPI000E401A2C|nr:trace amine-associated receptor 13c-like [Astatotilapia calliptera]
MMEGVEFCFPHLLNSSCRKALHPVSVSTLIYMIISSISVLTATLNLLVIISISHFKQLHNPTNFLLLSLAVSDFFVGLYLLFYIMFIDGCWYFGDFMCILYYVIGTIITSSSIGTMVLISVDRYVAICDPLHYPTKVTAKRVQICVSLCWSFSALAEAWAFLVLKDNLKQQSRFNSCVGECVVHINFIEYVADLALNFLLPITVIIVLYLRIFVVVVSQVRAMRTHTAGVTYQCSRKGNPKKSEMKAARTLGIVVIAFLSCALPFYCVTLTGQNAFLNGSSSAFVLCLFYFNSCLNPIVYALFYPWFRKSIKLIVTFQILKSGSRNANIVKVTE